MSGSLHSLFSSSCFMVSGLTFRSLIQFSFVYDVRPETIKILQENIGSRLVDVSLGDYFLDLIPKGKIKKWD